MAQNVLTVLNPSPTPPTNMSFLGQTPPNAPAQPAVDDGTAGSLGLFAVKTASVDNALFPSVEHEGRGNELSVTAPGSRAECPTIAVSCGPTLPTPTVGGAPISPNQLHASSMNPATNPALASITPTTTVSGAGTQLLTCTGTNFVAGCRIVVNGVQRDTTFVSATSLTATVPKRPNAGTWPVQVFLGGVAVPATQTWTFT